MPHNRNPSAVACFRQSPTSDSTQEFEHFVNGSCTAIPVTLIGRPGATDMRKHACRTMGLLDSYRSSDSTFKRRRENPVARSACFQLCIRVDFLALYFLTEFSVHLHTMYIDTTLPSAVIRYKCSFDALVSWLLLEVLLRGTGKIHLILERYFPMQATGLDPKSPSVFSVEETHR